MTRSFLATFVIQAAAVALVVYLTRWLSTLKGSNIPSIQAGRSTFRVKWQIRALGYASAAFCSLLALKFNADWMIPSRIIFPILFWLLALAGLWLASGVIIIDDRSVTKRVFGMSRSLSWDQIEGVCVIKNRGLIEVNGGHRSLTVDARINATEYLIGEICRRTGIHPRMVD